MENITPKDIRYVYESYKFYLKVFDEVKDDLKKHLEDIKPKLRHTINFVSYLL